MIQKHIHRVLFAFFVFAVTLQYTQATPCQDEVSTQKLHQWAVQSHREFWTLIGRGAGYEARNETNYQYVRAPSYYGLNYVYIAKDYQNSDALFNMMKDRAFTVFFEGDDDDHMFKYITILREANTFVTMGMDLKKLNQSYKAKPNVKVWKVETDSDYEKWIQTMANRRNNQKEQEQLRTFYDAFKPSKKNSSITFYLGSINGEIAGTATLYHSENFVSLFSVGVHPNHRRHGLGSALSYFPLKDAVKSGYRWTVLQAQPDGVSVYPQIGFEKVGSMKVFYHTPQSK